MEFEFKRGDDFLSLEMDLQNGDYLYEHTKNTYPLKDDFDLANLHFVTNSQNGTAQIYSMSGDKERIINYSELTENWWIMKLPDFIRKKIGLS